MSDDLTKEVIFLTGNVRLFLFDNKDDEAIETLNEIINKLSIVNTEDELKKILLLSYIDRIELFYKKEKFEDLVNDVNCLKKLNYNIYRDKRMLLIYHKSQKAINDYNMIQDLEKFERFDKEIEDYKENIINSSKKRKKNQSK
ncbi:unnamed protein product [Rotaria magnacalcarata]|uniref:Uncharacterized protein n=2 Tax=Rotaria magnacalcarata TaxID=392030 RepID=A0A816YF16_9BILA|nr:unnamed protein product [Rotaria magnacalcarata]CAF1508195.1 unnamed protein product [Rotaria magnacalcarata]CAF2155972.1 unnamed protein product [Rotaria magnacalcarata]